MKLIKIITINLLIILLVGCASTNTPYSTEKKSAIKNIELSDESNKYEKIPQNLLDSASNGNAGMQFNVGLRFHKGRGVRQDLGEAIKWYERAATQGLVQAQVNLGLMHYDGKGTKVDKVLAAKWLEKAVEQGDDGAQYSLGMMYGKGDIGEKRDMKKSIELLTLSAKQNNKLAISFLMKFGLAAGVTPSITIITAAEGDTELCSAGIMESCFDLGNLYQRGAGGVKRDSQKAYEFQTKACAGGYKIACYYMGSASIGFYSKGNNGDEKKKNIHYEKACNEGYKPACFTLGVSFLGGFGVEKNEKMARNLFLKSCGEKKANACMYIALSKVKIKKYIGALQAGDFEVAARQLMYPENFSIIEKEKKLLNLVKKLKKIHAELGDILDLNLTAIPAGKYGIYSISMIPASKHPSVGRSITQAVFFSKAREGGLYFKVGKIDGQQGIYGVEYWCFTCKNRMEGKGVRMFYPFK